MNIVADENIPFARELFSLLGSVTLLPGRTIANSDLLQCDALLVRSVTKVNAELLKSTPVKFVGTCTIGEDHLDIAYLNDKGISYTSAPGCNANSVVQYVICATAELNRLNCNNRVAVVGGGNVGRRVYKTFKTLGFECVVVDPFLNKEDQDDLHSFDAIFNCDIVCLHTPLTRSGPHPTFHMLGYAELKKLKPGALLINAGRGEVVNNTDLLSVLKKYKATRSEAKIKLANSQHSSAEYLQVVLDVWENEPAIKQELFEYLALGTPHIAGYSFEGKANGSLMIFNALATFLGKDSSWIEKSTAALKTEKFGAVQPISVSSTREALKKSYAIRDDSFLLEKALDSLPQSFDVLRKDYHQRREFSHYSIENSQSPNTLSNDSPSNLAQGNNQQVLEALGFLTGNDIPLHAKTRQSSL